MIAYEIQLWYVIRDKIQSETNSFRDKIQSKAKFSQEKNFEKNYWKKNFVGKKLSDMSCLGQIDACHHLAVYTYRNENI